jgi:sterol desaturase/sphingolipid hydroxylase (fatty acid hydroxylase superfamily)
VIHFFWDRVLGTYREPDLKTGRYYPRNDQIKFLAFNAPDS